MIILVTHGDDADGADVNADASADGADHEDDYGSDVTFAAKAASANARP